MGKQSQRIAILGAGPIGLEAALYARTLGHDVAVFEQGQAAEQVARWGHVRMFSPFGWNSTPLGRKTVGGSLPEDGAILHAAEYRDAYLVPLAESPAIKPFLQLQTQVLTVGRVGWRKTDTTAKLPPFRLLVRGPQQEERFEEADAVLDCTGTYQRPNWAGDGGIPAAGEINARPNIMYWNDDILGAKSQHYADRSIILIGDGHSAATTICALADLAESHQSTWVFWLTHGAKGAPLPRNPGDPLRERDRLAARANALACRCDANLEFHAQTRINELISHGPDKGFRVAGTVCGRAMTWEVDRVIANVGYRPDMTVCQELRAGEPTDSIITGEPGYFFLGAKSRGRNGTFLLRDGYEQIREVFQRIAADPRLDLYSKAA